MVTWQCPFLFINLTEPFFHNVHPNIFSLMTVANIKHEFKCVCGCAVNSISLSLLSHSHSYVNWNNWNGHQENSTNSRERANAIRNLSVKLKMKMRFMWSDSKMKLNWFLLCGGNISQNECQLSVKWVKILWVQIIYLGVKNPFVSCFLSYREEFLFRNFLREAKKKEFKNVILVPGRSNCRLTA